jgi:hypothetical protein
MNCEEARERAELFADGALPPEESRTFSSHVAHCDHCRSYLEDGRALAIGVRRAGRPRRRPLSRALVALAALALIAATAVSFEALHVWSDARARSDSLAAAERVLVAFAARGLSPADVGEHRFETSGAPTIIVRVSGGPALYELRATVAEPAATAAPPVELTAICRPWGGLASDPPEVRP